MEKWTKTILVWTLAVSLILVLFTGSGLLYQFGGLRYYLQATSYINKLSGAEKKTVSDALYGTGEDYLYSGILAGVWIVLRLEPSMRALQWQ